MKLFIFQVYRTNESENAKELKQLSVDSVSPSTALAASSPRLVKIKMPNDCTDLSGCTFSKDGGVVLCDYRNSILILLDATFSLKEILQLDYQPWDVSQFDSSSVIITVPKRRKLKFIHLFPTMMLGRSLKVVRACYGVQVAQNNIYVTCHNNPGKGEVLVLDSLGHIKHRLGRPDKNSFLFTSPGYITVSSSPIRVFVTDFDTHTISCLMPDGTVVYQHRDKELRGPRDVCVDGGENIIICALDSNNVQVTRDDGTKRYTLLTPQNGVSNPHSVAYRQWDNTLILGCWSTPHLFVYKVNKTL